MKTTSNPKMLMAVFTACFTLSATAAGPSGKMTNPDFTKGDVIPADAPHDWNLGATGARGWMYSETMVTTEARQIAVTKVEVGSPADGMLEVGDVLLGVGSKPFSYDPRTEMGKALTLAESDAGGGKLALTRWRAGKTEEIVVEIPVLGDYSATAPYDCPKSKRILEEGCEALAKRMEDSSYQQNPITRSLNALALLASGNPKYLPLIKREAQWASEHQADSMATWYFGYVIMLLAEYQIATGDDSFMPGLRRLTLEAAAGQSIVGSWGHRFANPDGRLAGYGMMNAPGVPLTVAMVTAVRAGVDEPEVRKAIERSARLLRFYIGKGALPYGDHSPWDETHEDNGKCGMAAVLFDQMNEVEGAEFFSRMSVASHGPERDTGHTGNFFNLLWAMPGVARSGPQATGAWMEEFGAWYFDLARRWDGNFVHLGPPEMRNDSYGNWDPTGAYLLAYAMPLKQILLTGKRPSIAPQLDEEASRALILDGRGWSNKDRNSAYDALNGDQLLECLESWSPVVRERAAMAFARRKEAPIAALLKLLDSPKLESKYGACQALAKLRGAAAPAVDKLRETLRSEDLWLRIEAAEALSAIGPPATVAVPELLQLLSEVDTEKDPRGMQQRYFSFALFNRGGLLGSSLEGVDRELLGKAVRSGLRNEDGRARGSLASVYSNLSFEEIKPLLPAVLDAVVEPAPSGIMFADQIRMEGLKVLAKHRVEEGIQACVDYARNQNPWASQQRVPVIMDTLSTYGAHAKSVIPELKKIADVFEAGEKDFPKRLSLDKAASVRAAIAKIESSDEMPELIRMR